MLGLGRVRVAIVADTHGFLDPRIAERVEGCEYAVHAGDVGCAAVLEAMRPRQGLLAVYGNNDLPSKWPPGEAGVLACLPAEVSLKLPGGSLSVVHGDRVLPVAQRHNRLRRAYPQARAIAYGHSHRLICDLEQTPWVLNPGAAGRARTYGGPSCIILTAEHGRWQVESIRFQPISQRRRA
jgi:putative phosphoesterase